MPNDPLYLKVIGQRVEWSFLDTKAVNFFYCNGLYTRDIRDLNLFIQCL